MSRLNITLTLEPFLHSENKTENKNITEALFVSVFSSPPCLCLLSLLSDFLQLHFDFSRLPPLLLRLHLLTPLI